MPLLHPADPELVTAGERKVWELLRDQLGPDDLLIANLRLTDRQQDREADLVVAFADGGVVVVEVKGSRVWLDGGRWWQELRGRPRRIHPVDQARDCKYALRGWITEQSQWRGRGRVRWGHAVVLPFTEVGEDFDPPDAPRWMVAGRDDLDGLADRLREIVLRQDTAARLLSVDDVHAVLAALGAPRLAQRDVVGAAAEREEIADALTRQQSVLLDAVRVLPRVEIRGGAGSGKTWLAVEQARRLARSGRRVALVCYSRGLAAWLTRRCEVLDRRERPAYVGTFHGLGRAWGAPEGGEDDSDFWERRLPEQMVSLAGDLPDGQRFDDVVVDEAQDFADTWWPVLDAAQRRETPGLFAFSDEGQRVFSRFGGVPGDLVPLVLDRNLRNTRQIGATFSGLAPIRMRPSSADGPAVELAPCDSASALDVADDQVDRLLEFGWRPRDLCVLATGSRHPEQSARQADGQDSYWDSFWDDDQVFYGHVLGFKGLERAVVVLAVNDADRLDRARERLYVGLSRARDHLVVCGDPDHLRTVLGPSVLDALDVPSTSAEG